MMITVAVNEQDVLTADDISNFSIMADEIARKILIYHRQELLGSIAYITGIDIDDFLNKVEIKS